MRFRADEVEARIGDMVANVFFGDRASLEEGIEPKVLAMSRAVDIPDSVYYYEIADQSGGRYGGLSDAVLSRNALVLTTDDGDEIAVDFEVPDDEFEALRAGLVAVLESLLRQA